jgi:hypothetical protein
VKLFITAILALCPPSVVHAQKWLDEPKIRVCENVVTCDDEKHIDLTGEEIVFVESLLKGIPKESSTEVINRHFGHFASNTTEPISSNLGKWKGKIHRSTWLTSASATTGLPPHVDVYFIDGQAFMLKWWFKNMKKMVQITYVQE